MDKDIFLLVLLPLISSIGIPLLQQFGGNMLQSIKPSIQLIFFCFAVILFVFAILSGISIVISNTGTKYINTLPIILISTVIGIVCYPLLYKSKDRIYKNTIYTNINTVPTIIITVFDILHSLRKLLFEFREKTIIDKIPEDVIIELNKLYPLYGTDLPQRLRFYIQLNKIMDNANISIEKSLVNNPNWSELQNKLDNICSILGDDNVNINITFYIQYIIGETNSHIINQYYNNPTNWSNRISKIIFDKLEAKLNKSLKKHKFIQLDKEYKGIEK